MLGKAGSFVTNTVTGNQAVTGIGFQPTAVIFKTIGLTAVGNAVGPSGTGPMFGFGVATDATHRWALSLAAEDAVNPANFNGRYAIDRCLTLQVPNNVAIGSADFVSMDADGFTINWVTAPPIAALVEYIALGDVDAFAFNDNLRTTLGDESLTGFGFTPKALIACTTGSQSVPGAGGQSGQTNFCVGVATSATERGSVGVRLGSDGATPTQAEVIQTQRALVAISSGGGLDWHHDVKTFDADGLTYTVTDAPIGAIADYWFGLALGGDQLQAKVVTDTQKTSTGTQAKTGAGFDPQLLLAFCRQNATAFESAVVTNAPARFAVGSTDGSHESCLWFSSEDAAATADVDRSHSQSKVLQFRDNSRTVLAEADLASLDADGYTLDWTTADGTARHFVALLLGGPPSEDVAVSAKATVTSSGQKDVSGSASASARPQTTATGSKAVSGSASSSATPRTTAVGTGGQAESGDATVSAKPQVTATGAVSYIRSGDAAASAKPRVTATGVAAAAAANRIGMII